MSQSYKPEVIADNSGEWVGNNLRFETHAEAAAYVRDLMMRWMMVRETRVVPSDDLYNAVWNDEQGSLSLVERKL